MTQTELVAEINTLLGRSLFVRPALKNRVLKTKPAQQKKALVLLRQMDTKQTDLFKQILTKNPHFFNDLENMAVQEVLQRLVAQESSLHLTEMESVEAELEQTLNLQKV